MHFVFKNGVEEWTSNNIHQKIFSEFDKKKSCIKYCTGPFL